MPLLHFGNLGMIWTAYLAKTSYTGTREVSFMQFRQPIAAILIPSTGVEKTYTVAICMPTCEHPWFVEKLVTNGASDQRFYIVEVGPEDIHELLDRIR